MCSRIDLLSSWLVKIPQKHVWLLVNIYLINILRSSYYLIELIDLDQKWPTNEKCMRDTEVSHLSNILKESCTLSWVKQVNKNDLKTHNYLYLFSFHKRIWKGSIFVELEATYILLILCAFTSSNLFKIIISKSYEKLKLNYLRKWIFCY